MASFLRRTLARARGLWDLAKQERASPRQIGVAVAIGTVTCFAPVLWLHLAAALALASLFRVNRLWASVASQLPSLFGLLRPFILFAELEIGHFVRTGSTVDLDPMRAFQEAPSLVGDWVVGATMMCLVLGPMFGLAAFAWAKRRARRAAALDALTPHMPDERRPPSSESPP